MVLRDRVLSRRRVSLSETQRPFNSVGGTALMLSPSKSIDDVLPVCCDRTLT